MENAFVISVNSGLDIYLQLILAFLSCKETVWVLFVQRLIWILTVYLCPIYISQPNYEWDDFNSDARWKMFLLSIETKSCRNLLISSSFLKVWSVINFHLPVVSEEAQ